MLIADLDNWPKNNKEAIALQEALRHLVRLVPLERPPRLVAGADAIGDKADRRLFGALALFTYPELELVEEAEAAGACPFPYRPGLLSFREIPVLAAAFRRLRRRPDVILVDGQGIAHPRGLGLAAHLGLVLDVPTIGVAKTRLVGEGAEPEAAAGSYSALIWQGKQVGAILRTRTGKKPLYLSPGHRITLPESLAIALGCVRNYRIPLPLRQADFRTRRLRAANPPPDTDPGPIPVGRSC